MIRLMGFNRRRPDLSLGAFSQYWRTIHRDIVLEFRDPLPIRGYVQIHRLPAEPPGMVSDFDGAPELWIDSAAGLKQLFDSPRFRHAAEVDTLEFIDMPGMVFTVADPVLDVGLSRAAVFGRVRLLRLFRRSADTRSLDDAWVERHTPLGMPGAAPLKLTRQVVLPSAELGISDCGYFGVESSWWSDGATLSRLGSSRPYAR